MLPNWWRVGGRPSRARGALRRPRHEQEDAFGGAPAALAADYPRSAISETVSGKFGLAELAKVFTLPWSAYALLISVKDARGSVAGIPSSRLRLSCRRHDNRAGHPSI